MNQLTEFLNANPNFRSAIRVFSYAFIASFVPAVLGFLGDVAQWANDSQGVAVFPGVDTLGKALVSAVVGAIAGAIAYVWNKVPIGVSAAYTRTNMAVDEAERRDRGESTIMIVLIVLAILALAIFIFRNVN